MEVLEKTELVTVVEQSGIEKSKGEIIANTLNDFFVKASEWNDTIDSLQINDVSEVGKMKMAREGRLTLKNMRLDAKKLVDAKRGEVKAAMADFVLEDKLWLKGFQMVEATFKNLETKLEEKEKFAERKEQERLNQLEKDRINLLLPYNEFCAIENMDLKSMSDEDFKAAFDKAKRLFDLDRAEKERIEKERIAKEKAEAEERERIRVENERLKREAEERERLAEIERKKREKAERERLAKEVKERKAREEKAAKERAEYEAKLKREVDEKAKIEAELKAKKYAEIAEQKRIEAEKIAREKAERKAALAPQKEKISAWVNSFGIPVLDASNFDDKASDKAKEIVAKFNSFKSWALKEIKSVE